MRLESPPVSRLDDRDHVFERSRIGDVRDRACLSAGIRDLDRHRLAALTVALGNDRDRATRREGLGEGAPQSPGQRR